MVVGIIFIGLIAFVLFSSRFSISNIEVARDNLHIDNAAIVNLLADYRGASIFAFSKKEASDLIRSEYPEFSRVEVRKLLPNTIKIELETHEIVANIRAYYVLPQVEKTLLEEEEDARLRELNKAFETVFDLEGEANEEKEEITPIEQKAMLNRIGQAIFDREEDLELMTITIDGLTQPIADRDMVVPADAMDFILNSIKYLTNLMQIEISGVRYLPVAREVHLRTDQNTDIWLTMEKDYKEQIDKLGAVWEAAELYKEDLSYIDLRIKEKLIYCPRRTSCDR